MGVGGGVQRRRGAILIIAMIIIFALASLAVVLGASMRVEATVSANHHAQREATAIARGAEQYVLALLEEHGADVRNLDESWFQAVNVGQGTFWIIRPDYNDPALPRYGLVDESSKLDLNFAEHDGLMRLEGMTEELATAIVNWRHEEGLADSSGYLSLPEPYRAKGAPFETVEELLMVRGMTRELLYGPLAAARLRADAHRAPARRALAGSYYQTHGLYDYFTVWSRQPTRRASGDRRINVNSQRQRSALRRLLNERLGETRGQEIGQRLGGPNSQNLLHFAVRTGLEPAELELLENDIRVGFSQQRPRGMVNINTAPREVLLALEQLEPGDVDALLGYRASGAREANSMAWVLNVFSDYDAQRQKIIALGNQITGRGGQYSADIVALSADGRAFNRVRIIVDARPQTPRIIYRRDQTDLGWPMDPAIRDSRRAGERRVMR